MRIVKFQVGDETLTNLISKTLGVGLVAAGIATAASSSIAQESTPNFLMIWGDDVGYWNISAYNQGMMGYKTPNIDSIAKDGPVRRRACRKKTRPLPSI
jgi:arylsulfatase